MTDSEYEGMLRRWKQGLEDLVHTIDEALKDDKYSILEGLITASAGSSMALMVRGDYAHMSREDRQGLVAYLAEADLVKVT
jgi:hypothetical protein